jgi:hypothetical protein
MWPFMFEDRAATLSKRGADNAEDFKQGAKIDKASVSRGGYMGSLLKIPLC